MPYTQNLPSVATLSRVFDDPKKAREVLKMTRAQLEETKAGAEFVRRYTFSPKTYEVRLHVLNSLDSGLHGVEWLGRDGGSVGDVAYLNTGDTYAATLLYVGGRYRVQSLGDFIEVQERRGCHYA